MDDIAWWIEVPAGDGKVGTGVPAVVGTNGDAQASAVAETIIGGGGGSCVPVAAELGCGSLPFLHFRLLEDSRSCSRKLLDTYEVGPKVGEGGHSVLYYQVSDGARISHSRLNV